VSSASKHQPAYNSTAIHDGAPTGVVTITTRNQAGSRYSGAERRRNQFRMVNIHDRGGGLHLKRGRATMWSSPSSHLFRGRAAPDDPGKPLLRAEPHARRSQREARAARYLINRKTAQGPVQTDHHRPGRRAKHIRAHHLHQDPRPTIVYYQSGTKNLIQRGRQKIDLTKISAIWAFFPALR